MVKGYLEKSLKKQSIPFRCVRKILQNLFFCCISRRFPASQFSDQLGSVKLCTVQFADVPLNENVPFQNIISLDENGNQSQTWLTEIKSSKSDGG